MTQLERHKYDVIVIGAGGAGLRAAVEARDAGLRVAPPNTSGNVAFMRASMRSKYSSERGSTPEFTNF